MQLSMLPRTSKGCRASSNEPLWIVDGVEHIVHQPGDLLGTDLDDRGELAFFARNGARGKETCRADDRIQLVPDLVAEILEQFSVQHAGWRKAVRAGATFHRPGLLLARQ